MTAPIEASLKRLDNLKSEIRNIFRDALRDHLTFQEILLLRSHRIFDAGAYKLLPRWAESELMGYFEGSMDCYQAIHTEERWRLNGSPKLYRKDREREEAFRGQWGKVSYAGTYYVGTDVCFSPPRPQPKG